MTDIERNDRLVRAADCYARIVATLCKMTDGHAKNSEDYCDPDILKYERNLEKLELRVGDIIKDLTK